MRAASHGRGCSVGIPGQFVLDVAAQRLQGLLERAVDHVGELVSAALIERLERGRQGHGGGVRARAGGDGEGSAGMPDRQRDPQVLKLVAAPVGRDVADPFMDFLPVDHSTDSDVAVHLGRRDSG
jgi:hypothetical protein